MINIHEAIGWFYCANLRCIRHLDHDHVTLTTTAHMRRFCSVECITEGQAAWHDLMATPQWGAATSDREYVQAVLTFIGR